MSFLLDIINGVNKFLGYLDISPKYLNRAYTFLSIFPTLYILRIVHGMFRNGNRLQGTIYLLVFIVLVYFILLNLLYYFKGKNSRLDITQLFVKYLPDDAFNIQQEETDQKHRVQAIDTREVEVAYDLDYQLYLALCIQELTQTKKLPTNDLSLKDGYFIEENTLYPYYFIKELSPQHYEIQIGTSYQNLKRIGEVQTKEPLKTVGLYIVGGDFVKDEFRYHESYGLKLLAKKSENHLEEHITQTRSQKRKN